MASWPLISSMVCWADGPRAISFRLAPNRLPTGFQPASDLTTSVQADLQLFEWLIASVLRDCSPNRSSLDGLHKYNVDRFIIAAPYRVVVDPQAVQHGPQANGAMDSYLKRGHGLELVCLTHGLEV